jgi:hypothetical protein
MRPEIGQQGIGDPAKAFSPRVQCMLAINRDTQNLGIYPFEPVESDLVRRDLRRSYRGPGNGKKGDDYIFATQKITQAHFFAAVVFKTEIRGVLTDA